LLNYSPIQNTWIITSKRCAISYKAKIVPYRCDSIALLSRWEMSKPMISLMASRSNNSRLRSRGFPSRIKRNLVLGLPHVFLFLVLGFLRESIQSMRVILGSSNVPQGNLKEKRRRRCRSGSSSDGDLPRFRCRLGYPYESLRRTLLSFRFLKGQRIGLTPCLRSSSFFNNSTKKKSNLL
jgi:hypothetical protein